MEILERDIPFRGYRTNCRILSSDSGKIPLILVHGGPGSGRDSFELLDDLAYQDERTLLSYDQLGCGKSSDDAIPEDWLCSATWVDELENLLDCLGWRKVFLLGHSWGGMLLLKYLIRKQDDRIQGVILSSTLSSSLLWAKEARRLVSYLSEADREAIEKAISENDFTSLEFQNALANYSRLFISLKRDGDVPECLRRKKPEQGKKAYERAWGPCEFLPMGELKDYDVTQDLGKINVPVLLLSGTDDESTPLINKTMFDGLRCEKTWVLLEGARHLSYYDRKEEYIKAVLSFMHREEKKNGKR